jgi:hypothetical protein
MATSSSPVHARDVARRNGMGSRDEAALSRASADNASGERPAFGEGPASDEGLASDPSHAPDPRYLELAERIAHWMDRRYIDPILGLLLPGAGDAIGAGIGLLGVYAAFRMRAHPIVIARMLIHLAADSVLGSIPVLGAVADFFYKAHSRNLELLRSRDVRKPKRSDWLTVAAAATLFVGALLLPIVLVGLLAAWLLKSPGF